MNRLIIAFVAGLLAVLSFSGCKTPLVAGTFYLQSDPAKRPEVYLTYDSRRILCWTNTAAHAELWALDSELPVRPPRDFPLGKAWYADRETGEEWTGSLDEALPNGSRAVIKDIWEQQWALVFQPAQ